MKKLMMAALLLSSTVASASGVCTNDNLNPGFAQLCRMQGTNGGKSACAMTTGCRWISLEAVGVCTNNELNPGFAQLCRMQGQNGGKPACDMTNGCEWVDLEQ